MGLEHIWWRQRKVQREQLDEFELEILDKVKPRLSIRADVQDSHQQVRFLHHTSQISDKHHWELIKRKRQFLSNGENFESSLVKRMEQMEKKIIVITEERDERVDRVRFHFTSARF